MNTVTMRLRAEVIETANRDNASSSVTQTAQKRKLNNPHSFDRFKGTELDEDTQEHYTVCRLRGGQGGVEKLSLPKVPSEPRALFLLWSDSGVQSKTVTPQVTVSVHLSEHSHHPIP